MIQRKIGVFFGHRDAPETIKSTLQETILRMLDEGVTCFYVGNHGRFDAMAMNILSQLRTEHFFDYAVAVTGFAAAKKIADHPTIIPEGVEVGPPRFAIDRRNCWLVDQADIVIAYISYDWGGAVKYVKRAHKKGRTILNLGNDRRFD